MKIHELKTLQPYFADVGRYDKKFEIRKDDRDFEVGDKLILKEFDGKEFSGRVIHAEITYILRDAVQYGLMQGYCIMAIKLVLR